MQPGRTHESDALQVPQSMVKGRDVRFRCVREGTWERLQEAIQKAIGANLAVGNAAMHSTALGVVEAAPYV